MKITLTKAALFAWSCVGRRRYRCEKDATRLFEHDAVGVGLLGWNRNRV